MDHFSQSDLETPEAQKAEACALVVLCILRRVRQFVICIRVAVHSCGWPLLVDAVQGDGIIRQKIVYQYFLCLSEDWLLAAVAIAGLPCLGVRRPGD